MRQGLPALIPLLIGILPAAASAAGLGVSAQGAFTFHTGDDIAFDLNAMNRGDNPFAPFQVLVMTEAAIDAKTSLFLEIPVNSEMPSSLFQSNLRPWARLSELGGARWLNLQAGVLPTLFGTFGERSSSTSRVVISTPLLYFYHTAIRPSHVPAGPDHFFQPGIRGGGNNSLTHEGVFSFGGLPPAYDACWDAGVELFGSLHGVQASLSSTMGTVSHPAMNADNYNDGYGVSGRLGYLASSGALFGLRVGASGAYGPYLDQETAESPSFPAGASPEDYANTALGLDLEYARGPWQLFAEAGRVGWEVPNVSPTLTTDSYYVELVRDLGPLWSVAARQEGLYFNDITSSEGVTEPWDYGLTRWEAAVAFRFNRGARVRTAYQVTRFPDAPHLDGELFALQLQVWMP